MTLVARTCPNCQGSVPHGVLRCPSCGVHLDEVQNARTFRPSGRKYKGSNTDIWEIADFLMETYSREELETLADRVMGDNENIAKSGKGRYAELLVQHCKRHGLLLNLIKLIS